MATTAEELSKRTAAIRAHYKRLRAIPGSGHHNKDPQTAQRKRENVPEKHEHAIAHHDADEHTFVGECATRVKSALGAFAAANQELLADDRLDPTDRTAIRLAKKYADLPPAADGTLRVRNGDWNAVLHALTRQGLGVTAAGVTGLVAPPDETEDD